MVFSGPVARRSFIMLGCAAIAVGFATQGSAQEFPSRPLSMVVAAAAGGPIDVFGRIMAERMGELLGKSVDRKSVV